jgi:hypothetical protein
MDPIMAAIDIRVAAVDLRRAEAQMLQLRERLDAAMETARDRGLS